MFLGIDVGTSCVKAVVTAASGEVLAQSSADLSVARPQPLWSEQAPADWVEAAHKAVLGIDPALRGGVQAVGLAGQMHGATLLGSDDRPLRPAILWNDGRSFAECAALEADEPRTRAITGNIAMPGFTAPKLAWVRKHEPDVFAATRTVLLPKDYVRLALTGEKASDMSDSAGTLCSTWPGAPGRAKCWPRPALDERHMPRLHEGPDVTGVLREDVARDWGMGRVPVVAGAGDNAAGALGVGVAGRWPGHALARHVRRHLRRQRGVPAQSALAVHAFCHALPGVWHQMSVHLSAASCIDWAARACNVPGPAEFFALAEQARRGQRRRAVPALSFRRTHAAQRSAYPRRVPWPWQREHHAAPGRRRARRRGLRPMPTGSTRCAEPARGSRNCA